MRYSSKSAGGQVGGSYIFDVGQKDYGRSISPNFVEDVLKSGKLIEEAWVEVDGVKTLRQIWGSGTVQVVTEQNKKIVVTIMTK